MIATMYLKFASLRYFDFLSSSLSLLLIGLVIIITTNKKNQKTSQKDRPRTRESTQTTKDRASKDQRNRPERTKSTCIKNHTTKRANKNQKRIKNTWEKLPIPGPSFFLKSKRGSPSSPDLQKRVGPGGDEGWLFLWFVLGSMEKAENRHFVGYRPTER